MTRVFSADLIITYLLVLAVFAGCRNQDNGTNGVIENQNSPSVTGWEIVHAVVDKYSNAESYSDKAVLYLTYRLNGKLIKEPHPWSVAWNREGQFSADLFNAKIRNDGQRLSCYVFDIETGNIDNQHLLVDSKPFSHLLNDGIASHFLFGTSELPLDEFETEQENQLIPPMMKLLEAESFPVWLAEPESAELIGEDSSFGVDCYVVKSTHQGRCYSLWVAKTSGMIEQIELPLQYLDSEILASDEVSSIRFFVRFHDAKLNSDIDRSAFRFPDRLAAKTVRQFVKLPEPLPCERLGEPVDEFNLFRQNGESFAGGENQSAKVLIWIPGFNAKKILEDFDSLATQNDALGTQFAAVFSDELVKNTKGSRWSLANELLPFLQSSKTIGLFDPQLEFVSELGIKSVPVLVVLDAKNVIQYVRHVDQNDWVKDAKVAIARVVAGEDVAVEMRNEYQSFLDDYHKQLVVQSSQPGSATNELNVESTPLKTRTIWTSDALTNPKTIHVPKNSRRILVLDGWQSVGEYNFDGELVNRIRLSIPSHIAINRLVSVMGDRSEIYFAAYSMLGKQAFVFDEQWKLLFEFNVSDLGSTSGISQCQLLFKEDEIKLMVALLGPEGIVIVDSSGQTRSISEGPCRAFCVVGKTLFNVDRDGAIFADSKPISGFADWKFDRLQIRDAADESCFGLAKNGNGFWQVFEISPSGMVWTRSISPPKKGGFDQIDSIVSPKHAPMALFAQEQNTLRLIGHDVDYEVKSGLAHKIQGLAAIEHDNLQYICVSDGRLIRALTYSTNANPVRPASMLLKQ